MHGLYHPEVVESRNTNVVASLERLARVLKSFGLIAGWVDRQNSRFLDVHCYPAKTTRATK